VVDGHLRAVDHDLVELGESERAPALNVANGVERGVVAPHAGVELERDAHGLESFTEPSAELVEIEAVMGARKRRAEPAVRRLEYIHDAGEATLRQQRAVEPALRRSAGMHALDHGAVLCRHQPGSLRPGDAEGVNGLARGKS
jgi:hypothetical protein